MPQFNFNFEALGTYFEIVTKSPLGDEIKGRMRSVVDEFDRYFSRFRSDSLVHEIASKAGSYEFPVASWKLFELYETLYGVTKGKVNPLVGNSLEALGYDAQYSLIKQTAIPALKYEQVIKRKHSTITTIQPVTIDVGAAGKGYIVDVIAELLDAEGINDYIIDASGDIKHKAQGGAYELIGLEDPIHTGKVIGEVKLQNQSLCASATNRRTWGNGMHHIVDPVSGKPTKDIIATWVIADTAMVADGLATALFFTDPNLLKQSYNYEYMRVHAAGKIEFSAAFKESLY